MFMLCSYLAHGPIRPVRWVASEENGHVVEIVAEDLGQGAAGSACECPGGGRGREGRCQGGEEGAKNADGLNRRGFPSGVAESRNPVLGTSERGDRNEGAEARGVHR